MNEKNIQLISITLRLAIAVLIVVAASFIRQSVRESIWLWMTCFGIVFIVQGIEQRYRGNRKWQIVFFALALVHFAMGLHAVLYRPAA